MIIILYILATSLNVFNVFFSWKKKNYVLSVISLIVSIYLIYIFFEIPELNQ